MGLRQLGAPGDEGTSASSALTTYRARPPPPPRYPWPTPTTPPTINTPHPTASLERSRRDGLMRERCGNAIFPVIAHIFLYSKELALTIRAR